MTTAEASVLAGHLLANLQRESEITRKVIAAIPDDKAGYQVHPKSRTALALAWHIVADEIWFLDSIFQGEFYSEPAVKPPEEIHTAAEMNAWYAKEFESHVAKALKLSGDYLARPISFLRKMDLPAVMYLQMCLSHSIHHRGQLAAYLRAMGAKVPSIYGPSLDEPAS